MNGNTLQLHHYNSNMCISNINKENCSCRPTEGVMLVVFMIRATVEKKKKLTSLNKTGGMSCSNVLTDCGFVTVKRLQW